MSKRFLNTWLSAILIFVLASTSIFFIPTAEGKTLKIGAIWGLSGPGSQLQVIMRDGAELATRWLNENGGISVAGDKYSIELVVEDNKGTAEGSVTAATKLVLRDKLKFVSGMIVPFQIDAAQTVTESNGVLLASGKLSALHPDKPLTFSCTQGLTVPLPGLYDFLLERYPHVKKVSYTAPDEPGATKVLGLAQKIGKTHGLETMKGNLTQFGAKDYYPIWSKMIHEKPDAVDITVNFFESVATLVRHGRELGFKGPILTVTTGDALDMIKLIGKDLTNGVIAPVFDAKHPATPPMVGIIEEMWNENYKSKFHISSLIGWSSIWCLSQAIESANSLDPVKVKNAWQKMETIETPWGTGQMGGSNTFGLNNMVIPPTSITLLDKGRVEHTKWYQPSLP